MRNFRLVDAKGNVYGVGGYAEAGDWWASQLHEQLLAVEGCVDGFDVVDGGLAKAKGTPPGLERARRKSV